MPYFNIFSITNALFKDKQTFFFLKILKSSVVLI